MRITGGIYKGRKIKCPPGIIRPAMDRMRESLFAILGDLAGRSFLDLFSGSGVVGLEAASRGAGPVALVEKDFKKKYVIKENLQFAEQELRLWIKPAEAFIRLCKNRFDIIYIDPPFRYQHKSALLSAIDKNRLLAENGIIIIHFPREDQLPGEIGSLSRYDERVYGRSVLNFFSRAT